VSPEDAVVMATINPAMYHRLWRLGAIAPGYQADILVLDDLKSFKPRQVLKRGAPPRFVKLEVPEWVRQTVSLAPVDASTFAIKAGPKKIRVIKVIPAQLLTDAETELAKLPTRLTDHVDGHAPGVRGPRLNAYLAAGIRSDHESTTFEEALEKRRLGMWVMLREATGARNLKDLLPLVKQYGTNQCMFCTDDREPDFIVEEGHINQMVRVAVEEGVSPEDALVMATLNPAMYHRLWRLGAVAPGYQADILVLDDLKSFRPREVLKRGAPPRFTRLDVPEWVRQTVNLGPVDETSFRIPSGPKRIRVIRVIPAQLLTGMDTVEPSVRDGQLVADPSRDLVKIAVLERHHATGRVGLGFASNVGLKRGAFASTVAHDAHNLVVLGADDGDMAACAARLAEIGGGIVIAEGGKAVEELPLPIAGLMSDRPLAEVHERLRSMERRLAAMGSTMASPFMTLSFLALSVIPELKITERGLVDVGRFELVPLSVE